MKHWFIYRILTLGELLHSMLTPLITLLVFSQMTPFFSSQTPQASRVWYYGLIAGLAQFAVVVAHPLFGYLSDRLSRKQGLLLCCRGYIVFPVIAIAAIWTQSLMLIIAALMIMNLFNGFKTITVALLNERCQKEEKVRHLSLVQLAVGLGFLVGPSLSGWLSEKSLMGKPFLLVLLIMLAGSFLLRYSISRIPEWGHQASGTHQPGYPKNANIAARLKHIFIQPWAGLLVGLMVLDQICWGGYYLFAPVLGRTLFHFSGQAIGWFVSLLGFVLVVSSGVVIPVLQRYLNDAGLLKLGALLLCLGVVSTESLLVLPVSTLTEGLFWAALFPTLLGDVMIFTLILSWLTHEVPSYDQGLAVGFIYVIGNTTWSLTSFASGYLGHHHIGQTMLIPALTSAIMLMAAFKVATTRLRWQ